MNYGYEINFVEFVSPIFKCSDSIIVRVIFLWDNIGSNKEARANEKGRKRAIRKFVLSKSIIMVARKFVLILNYYGRLARDFGHGSMRNY